MNLADLLHDLNTTRRHLAYLGDRVEDTLLHELRLREAALVSMARALATRAVCRRATAGEG